MYKELRQPKILTDNKYLTDWFTLNICDKEIFWAFTGAILTQQNS